MKRTDGAGAATGGIAVDRSDSGSLADLEAAGGSGSSKAEGGNDEGECVHIDEGSCLEYWILE